MDFQLVRFHNIPCGWQQKLWWWRLWLCDRHWTSKFMSWNM